MNCALRPALCASAGETCLALPKLNLQFLTIHDYLLRNFNLFRLEATYEIREDISDVLGRVGGTLEDDDDDNPVVKFHGWSRMALALEAFNIIEVKPPRVGENKPAAVTADIVIDTARTPSLPLHLLPVISVVYWSLAIVIFCQIVKIAWKVWGFSTWISALACIRHEEIHTFPCRVTCYRC